ncbi:hypothetical protein W02_32690 [Nitrospira sp. KM1]|nr:hypothetical protein W02_32690 [Nitrospira sp. KM1]
MIAGWDHLGKLLVGIGAVILLVGLVVMMVDRVPGMGSLLSWFGRLPGDLSIKRENFSFYFPLGTSLLLSLLLSLVFYFLSWMFRR